ncbi:MAG: trypsin-like peptidase domain-containing protein [Bacteroidota bacterium]
MRTSWTPAIAFLVVLVQAEPVTAESLRELFKKVRPSVVVIMTEETLPEAKWEKGEPTKAGGLGSGVIISKDGKILTASHVVHLADRVAVRFADGNTVPARIIGSEPNADIALIQIERLPGDAVVAPLANSDSMEVGDDIFVVGAPYGLTYSLSAGRISARHAPKKYHGGFTLAEFFQTDASINKGNSGGPMFNMKGEVVGIVSHILTQSGGFEGLGFAVTSNLASKLMLQERTFWGGVDGFQVSDDLAKALNLPVPVGYLVQRVAEGSFGKKLGLQGGTLEATIDGQKIYLGGDVILEMQGVKVGEELADELLRKKMEKLTSGSVITVTVWRWGKRKDLSQRWYPGE